MIDKKDILRLYRKLDKYQKNLVSQDPYWKKCSPCINKGCCCVSSDTTIFTSESKIINRYIKELPADIKSFLKTNVDNGIRCPFRTDTSCIIHDVRPLTCRITPYFANLRKNNSRKIDYILTSDDCTKAGNIEQDIIDSEMIKFYKSNLFVDLCIDYYGNQRKYINGDYLKINEETYAKLCVETSLYATDMLNKNYDNLFK